MRVPLSPSLCAVRSLLLRTPVRHEVRGPASLLVGKEAEFNKVGLFSTHKCASPHSAANMHCLRSGAHAAFMLCPHARCGGVLESAVLSVVYTCFEAGVWGLGLAGLKP